MLFDFLNRRDEREWEREKHRCEKEASISCLTFTDRGREEGEKEKHQCVVASRSSPAGDPTHNLGMCPDWESNHDPLVHRPMLNPLSYTSLRLSKLFEELSNYFPQQLNHFTFPPTTCKSFNFSTFSPTPIFLLLLL